MATSFNPQVDGFPFINSWTFDSATDAEIHAKLNEAVGTIAGFLPFIPALAPIRASIQQTLNGWVDKASTKSYGLCGGMAFAALDYHIAERALPNEPGPTDQLSAALRGYILGRMKDSFFYADPTPHYNLGKVLAWMGMEHLVPTGRRWLLGQCKQEFVKLQKQIATYGAWPLALIGEAQDPCENHQVLAYQCDPAANAIYIYDMNHPGAGRKLALDFSGAMLEAKYDFTGDSWQPLRAFFCEDYAPVTPTV